MNEDRALLFYFFPNQKASVFFVVSPEFKSGSSKKSRNRIKEETGRRCRSHTSNSTLFVRLSAQRMEDEYATLDCQCESDEDVGNDFLPSFNVGEEVIESEEEREQLAKREEEKKRRREEALLKLKGPTPKARSDEEWSEIFPRAPTTEVIQKLQAIKIKDYS
mgnify:CR=1 FL=1